MQADDLHPIAEGADYRAQLIAEGVKDCLGSDSGLSLRRLEPARSAPASREYGRDEAISSSAPHPRR